jgi:tRNA modification GTPase
MNPQDDIIAAIVTPIGEGGLSVLRVSGRGGIELSSARFRGKSVLSSAVSHTAHFGYFADREGEVIDEVVATVFRAPHSYTAEDTVEFSCHGGTYLCRKILESLLEGGARSAEPGEFTKRAFLNGRIDLSQAEAVADLISSRSEDSRRASMMQLQGKLSGKINELRENLLSLCSLLELELDFAEEGLEVVDKSNINNILEHTIAEIDALVRSYEYGKLYREGVRVALVGKPNAGKSSILNALLREDRAIVTPIPGTTRDVIEENVNIGGLVFTAIDTAGLRRSDDPVEQEGILRTEREIGNADIVVLVVESGRGEGSDMSLVDRLFDVQNNGKKLLVAVNKVDLDREWRIRLPQSRSNLPVSYLSAKTGEGIEGFRGALVSLALAGRGAASDRSFLVTNERHKNILATANKLLIKAKGDLLEGKSNEFIAVSLRLAMDRLGEIVGVVTSEDVLNNIFANFCIGK